MNSTRFAPKSLIVSFLLFALLLLFFAACAGGCGKARAPEPLSMPAAPSDAPITVPVLSLMPEKAVVALGIPPPGSFAEKAKRLISRADGSISDDDNKNRTNLASWNEFFEKFSDEYFSRMGIDSTRPMALFVADTQIDIVAEELIRILVASDDRSNAATDTSTADAGEVTDDSVPDQGASDVDFCADELRETLKKLQWAAVVPCVHSDDASLVANRLATWLEIDVAETTAPMRIGDVSVLSQTSQDGGSFVGFFLIGNWLFWSNDVELLEGMLDRLKTPLSLQYGTSTCPVTSRDDLVQLVRLDRLGPSIAAAIRNVTFSNASLVSWKERIVKFLGDLGKATASPDALVISLTCTEENLEFLLRVDSNQYPELLDGLGEAKPFDQLQFVPENAEAILAFHIDAETKRALESQVDNLLMGGMAGSADSTQVEGLGKVLTSWLGDHVVISAKGFGTDQPVLSCITVTPYPEAVKSFLTMLGGPVPIVEQYAGAEIYCLEGLPDMGEVVAFGVDKDTVFVSSDLSTLKEMLDLKSGDKKRTTPLENLHVSLPPEVSMYSFVVLKNSFLNSAKDLLQAKVVGDMESPGVIFSDLFVLLETLKWDLCMLNYKDGTWLSSKTVLCIN